ncbi:hypothetical protein P170DRAFT_354591, partial [Aspergillus steynii IBT 23096]
SNMFCMTSLVRSLKAFISILDNIRLTALKVTKEIIIKYKSVLLMPKTGQLIEQLINVIKAKKIFRISFFTGFSYIFIRHRKYHMILDTCFQGYPHKAYYVACPKSIRDSDLSEED